MRGEGGGGEGGGRASCCKSECFRQAMKESSQHRSSMFMYINKNVLMRAKSLVVADGVHRVSPSSRVFVFFFFSLSPSRDKLVIV